MTLSMYQKTQIAKAPAFQSETISSDASGDGSVVLGPFTGFLDAIVVTKGTLADTADLTVTVTRTSEQVGAAANVTASRVVRPRVTPHGIDGVALTALTVLERPFLHNDTLTVVVAQGGASKSGTIGILTV